MLNAAILASFILPLGMMAWTWRREGADAVILSHFWYLTLIWLVCFPLRAVALEYWGYEPLSGPVAAPEFLPAALLVALGGWLAVWAGHALVRPGKAPGAKPAGWPGPHPLAVAALSCAVFLAVVVVTADVFEMVARGNYFAPRVGHGHLFIAPELFVYAGMAALGVALAGSPGERRLAWAFTCVVLVVAAALSMITVSRRLVAMLFLAACVVVALRHRRMVALLAAVMVSSIAGASVLEALRRVWWYGIDERDLTLSREALATILKTFEGVEHVAAFIAKAGWQGVLLGVDRGVGWLFNLGLALVPRALWPAKPLLYGNVAQQHLIHPQMTVDGLPKHTLPPTFIVDFLYGFGVLGGICLAVGLGLVLRRLEAAMRDPHAAAWLRVFAIFVFAHSFAVVRSGTGFIQVALTFAVVLALVYGPSALWSRRRGRLSAC